MKALFIIAALALCSVGPVKAQTFSFASLGAAGGCSYTDGSAGAPAGAVALYPTVLSGYAHAPNNGCKWPDVGYGVGATGLGTPAAITSSASGTTTLTFSGGVPGYFVTGQSIVDISNYPTSCTPSPTTITAIAATTITVSQSLTCANGTTFATFHPATCHLFGSTCTAYSPPAGVSVDTTNHLIDVSGASRTVTGIDTSFDGGYSIFSSGSTTNITVTNVYGRIGANAKDPVIMNSAAAGGTISNNTFDGAAIDDGASESAVIGVYGTGTWTITYDRVINAFSDCFNTSTQGAVTLTPQQKYTSCINNGTGNPSPSCAHADWMQSFGSPSGGTLQSPVFIQNFWIVDGNNLASPGGPTAAGGQGWSCGDNTICISPDVETNLVILPNAGAGTNTPTVCGGNGWTKGINHPFQLDRSASLGTATVINNWVDPTGYFVQLLCLTPAGGSGCSASSGGTVIETGNINIITGATLSP